MQNFLLIDHGIDVKPLLMALYRQESLWNQHTFRTQTPGTPMQDVSDILLRLQPLDGSSADPRECVWYEAIHALPQAKALIYAVMARVSGERLGRCMMTKLPVGGVITPHKDVGTESPLYMDTCRYYERHHICLQADDKSIFACDGEFVNMQPGELWWVNTAKVHAVYNDGAVERIHLIIDVHCADSAR